MENKALKIIKKYKLKQLDAIQLASTISIKNELESFVGYNDKLNKVCKKKNINIFNTEKN